MTKKIFIVLLSLLALTACSGQKAAPKIDFEGPSGGPDIKKIMPTYGPNDSVPVQKSDGIPN
jgi:hypothetical protein